MGNRPPITHHNTMPISLEGAPSSHPLPHGYDVQSSPQHLYDCPPILPLNEISCSKDGLCNIHTSR